MIRWGIEYTLLRKRMKSAPVTFQYRICNPSIPVGFSGISNRLVIGVLSINKSYRDNFINKELT